ncbi:MAG: TIGR04086 family membrane protein [Oscillospiraceae bacterium]
MQKKTEEKSENKVLWYILHILMGGALALGCCVLFLLLCAVGIAQGWVKAELMPQLTIAGCVVGSLVGGTKAAGWCKTKTLLAGLGAGGVMFLLMLTVGALCFESMTPEIGGLPMLCGCLCGGGLAGLFAAKPTKKRRK